MIFRSLWRLENCRLISVTLFKLRAYLRFWNALLAYIMNQHTIAIRSISAVSTRFMVEMPRCILCRIRAVWACNICPSGDSIKCTTYIIRHNWSKLKKSSGLHVLINKCRKIYDLDQYVNYSNCTIFKVCTLKRLQDQWKYENRLLVHYVYI